MHISFDRSAPAAPSRSLAWTLSLLAHGLAFAWLSLALPQQGQRREDATPDVHFVLVTPRPPAPRPQAAPAPAPAALTPPRAARKPFARAARLAPRTDTPQPLVMPPDRPAPAPAFTVTAPAAAEGSEERGFDMAAARTAARAAIASDDAAAGPPRPLRATRDERLGRRIEEARRGDCQTQYAGAGLLAVIPLVKDTLTGTGCKWK